MSKLILTGEWCGTEGVKQAHQLEMRTDGFTLGAQAL